MSTDISTTNEALLQWLEYEIRDISEEYTGAQWYSGIEFSLWEAVAIRDREEFKLFGQLVDRKRLKRLYEVAIIIGMWIIWKGDEGATPVPLTEWVIEFKRHVKDRGYDNK